MKPTLVIILLCMSVTLSAQDQENSAWELRRDREGIQVYTRDVEDSPYDAVKAETVMTGVRLSSLVALIEDAEACPNWADRCAESYIYERISESDSLVYTHNDLPFPVRDRDVLARVSWSQDPQSLTVTMNSHATEGILSEERGRVRMTQATVRWIFEPHADGEVKIVSEAHIHPGSSIPGWLTNMLIVDTPFETVLALREEVRKPKYRDAEISFISEPGD